MKNHNLFSFRVSLIFSLILTESYFFTLRLSSSMISDRGLSYIALNRFQISDILISLLALLIFSFICVILYFYIIKKINKNLDFFLILAFAFVLANLIKIFFDYADYSWHYVGSRNVYPIISKTLIKKFFFFIWFLLPYIFSLIIVFSLRKKLEKLTKFFLSFSLVFFFIMSLQIFSLNKIYKNLNNGEIKFVDIKEKKDRKVLWIFFDVFDPKLAFSKQENAYEMTNFEKLFENSVVHHEFFSPAKDTLFSFASVLIGKDMIDATFSNHRMNIVTKKKETITLNFNNSIFGRLFDEGYDSSITGYGFHPFCKAIINVKCEVFNEPLKWYDGILNITQINNIKAHFFKIGSHRDINPYIIESMFNYIKSESPTNLLFVHNRVPHLCHKCNDGLAGMAEKYFNFEYRKKNDYLKLASDRRDAYLINLKFVDSLVGEIFNEIKKNDNYKKNETLVILSSDHWAKEYYGDFITRPFDGGKVPYPSLFLAKIIGDDDPFDIYEPDSGIHVQELIHEFLRKKISSHADINRFFSEKKGYSVFVDPEVQFIEKDDF